ncbi:MAG: hypothetical protein V5A23_03530 [Halobacteriales archaeon]
MPERNPPSLVDFDADAALAAVLEADAADDLRAVAEYTAEDYRILYLADPVIEEYGGREEVAAVADQLHEYLHLDFEERNFFEELYPPAEDAYGFATFASGATVVRVTDGDGGLFLSFAGEVNAGPLVERVRAAI